MMDLSVRHTEVELMDNPNLDRITLKKVFDDIDQANKKLGGHKITINAVWQLLINNKEQSYTIYDFGCGNGSMLRELALFLRLQEIEVKLVGIENRQEVIDIAREASYNFEEINYEKADILEASTYKNSCDIVLCTLTLHHFNNDQIPMLLNRMAKQATIGVIINDLQRSRWAHFLFRIFCLFFVKTTIGKEDGLTSIKSGFKKEDLERFAKQLPEYQHTIEWKWAFRYLWMIKKED